MLAVLPFIKINARIPQWQVNGLICHLGECYDVVMSKVKDFARHIRNAYAHSLITKKTR